jgi:HSP20 family molecular chaperone IbpA
MKRAPKTTAKLVVLETNDPISAEIDSVQRRIRERAFELSRERPRHVHEIYDWMMAESEIVSVPPAELVEKDGTFEVTFAVPGVKADEVKVLVSPGQILLRSDSTHAHDATAGTVHWCDFKATTVFRSVNLPQPVDVKTARINFDDGLLRVSAAQQGVQVPRKTAARKARAKQP